MSDIEILSVSSNPTLVIHAQIYNYVIDLLPHMSGPQYTGILYVLLTIICLIVLAIMFFKTRHLLRSYGANPSSSNKTANHLTSVFDNFSDDDD